MAGWDDEVDDLYTLAPGDFVAARNALAKRIRADGDKALGAEVAKRGRPTVVAWALNQAAREDPERVAGLIDAAAQVATAQADLMAGGDAAELRAASAAQRAAAGDVIHAAVALAGPAHADAVRTTLDAALADPDLVEQLRGGTLSETLEAPAGFGFGFDTGATVTELAPRRKARDARRAKAATSDDDTTAEADAAAAIAEARRVVAGLETELAKAQKTTARRTTALDSAQQELADAEDALTAATQRVDDAAENRDDAARELDGQREEEDRVAAALDEARRLLDDL